MTVAAAYRPSTDKGLSAVVMKSKGMKDNVGDISLRQGKFICIAHFYNKEIQSALHKSNHEFKVNVRGSVTAFKVN